MKNFLSTLLLLTFISCGKEMPHWNQSSSGGGNKPPVEEIIQEVFPEVLEEEGCDILYPQDIGSVVAVISCESGESYLLHNDGLFAEGNISDIELVEEEEVVGPNIEIINEENSDCVEDELVVNGSFEEGHGLGNNKWGLFTNLPGWYANTLRRDAAIEVQSGMGIGGIAPSDGTAKVELDSHDKDGFTKSDVVLVQDIVDKADETYVLSFDYSARVASDRKTNKARVFWNGKKIANLNNNTVGWKSYSIQVKSISELQRLEFIGKHDADTVGGYIDNVSLKRICN